MHPFEQENPLLDLPEAAVTNNGSRAKKIMGAIAAGILGVLTAGKAEANPPPMKAKDTERPPMPLLVELEKVIDEMDDPNYRVRNAKIAELDQKFSAYPTLDRLLLLGAESNIRSIDVQRRTAKVIATHWPNIYKKHVPARTNYPRPLWIDSLREYCLGETEVAMPMQPGVIINPHVLDRTYRDRVAKEGRTHPERRTFIDYELASEIFLEDLRGYSGSLASGKAADPDRIRAWIEKNPAPRDTQAREAWLHAKASMMRKIFDAQVLKNQEEIDRVIEKLVRGSQNQLLGYGMKAMLGVDPIIGMKK